MRVDLKKYLFIGMKGSQKPFFAKAQDLGLIDFIDANPEKHQEQPLEIQKNSHAIKILRGLPTTPQEELYDYDLADDIINEILEHKHHLDALSERERILKLEIERVAIFGNFSLEDIDYIQKIGHKAIQFFCSKKRAESHQNRDDLPPEVIFLDSDHGLDYFIAINDEPRHYEKMVEMKIDTPVGDLRRQLKFVKSEISKTEELLKVCAKYNSYLHHALIYKLNHYHLEQAHDYAQEEIGGTLFAVQGWVPINKIHLLDEIVKEFAVYYDEVAIEGEDRVPTCLQNEGGARIGEDLVHIYDTPSITDRDPSMWVLLFFSFFFAFIVGDGGYGLIFLSVSLYIRYKYQGIKRTGKRVLNLFTILACSCVVWGFLTTSFFGISFAPNSSMQSVSFLHWLVIKKADYHFKKDDDTFKEWVKQYPEIKNSKTVEDVIEKASSVRGETKTYEMYDTFRDQIMLELALLIGTVHILLSLARYLDRNWSAFGWIIFVIGGYMYFPYYLGASTVMHYVFGFSEQSMGLDGLFFVEIGMVIAVVLSLIQRKLYGLLEITAVIQIFGDILSYLRIYALGLAGSILSATVNELAGSVIFALGIFILLIGHSINIVLAVMGGVIHGLRLNFLEWYHYSFEGGGKRFNPLCKLEVD